MKREGPFLKKKYIASIVSLLLVVSCFLTGCSARSIITTEDFKKAAEDKGFTITTETTTTTGAKDALTASKDGIDIHYFIFEGDGDLTNAKSVYATYKSSIQNGNVTDEQILDSDTYCKYVASAGEIYHFLVRNGRTVVYGKTTLSHKDEVDQFFTDIKY